MESTARVRPRPGRNRWAPTSGRRRDVADQAFDEAFRLGRFSPRRLAEQRRRWNACGLRTLTGWRAMSCPATGRRALRSLPREDGPLECAPPPGSWATLDLPYLKKAQLLISATSAGSSVRPAIRRSSIFGPAGLGDRGGLAPGDRRQSAVPLGMALASLAGLEHREVGGAVSPESHRARRPEPATGAVSRPRMPFDLYELACLYSVLSGVGPLDKALPADQVQRIQTAAADRAMAVLRRAIAAGFNNVAHMNADPTSTPCMHGATSRIAPRPGLPGRPVRPLSVRGDRLACRGVVDVNAPVPAAGIATRTI